MLYYKSTTLFACGKRGIRTLGTRKGTTVFETVPIDHSGIFPDRVPCTAFGGVRRILQMQRYESFPGDCKFFEILFSRRQKKNPYLCSAIL